MPPSDVPREVDGAGEPGLVDTPSSTYGRDGIGGPHGNDAQAIDPFQTPPKAPRRKRRLRRLLLMLVLAGVVGAAGWWWLEGRLVTTPTLVGMTVAQAEQAADAEGLAVTVVGEEYSESIPAEAVVETDPAAVLDAATELGPDDRLVLRLGVLGVFLALTAAFPSALQNLSTDLVRLFVRMPAPAPTTTPVALLR